MTRPGEDEPAVLRSLPQLQRLLEHPQARVLVADTCHDAVAGALRTVLEHARAALRAGRPADTGADALLAQAAALLARAGLPGLRRAINATGIVLHTNLGRAPIAEAALAAVAEAARGYCTLEYDDATGRRGARAPSVEARLCRLTGAEAALVVNNGAAAVLLALSAHAGGPDPAAAGEVVVSRGELVEIGGGFRVPDVIRQGGARLVEVGTTNRTTPEDYRAAIGPRTRMLLHVHPSNFRVVGFTATPALPELAALARAHGVLLMADIGSGSLGGSPVPGQEEPAVRDVVAAGVDLVSFSGDKLLGGPQAGILVGTAAAIAQLRRHPLLRALRADKLTLAALEATLRLHEEAPHTLPVARMLAQDEAVLQDRAERLSALLPDEVLWRIEPVTAFAGGGALPGSELPSRAICLAVEGLDADALALRLRQHRPAVIGRIAAGLVALDMMAVAEEELALVAQAVSAAVDGK